jgi:hypothetical protein
VIGQMRAVSLSLSLTLFPALFLAGCSKAAARDEAASPSRADRATVKGAEIREAGNRAAPGSGGLDLSYTPPRLPGGTGSANVTYQPSVHLVEQKQGADAIVAESSNGHGLVFNTSSSQINSLKDGDVLVIKGLIARKVLAVERSGEEIRVITDQATLADVIKEGDLHVDAPITFGTLQARNQDPRHSWTDLLETPAYAQEHSASPENVAAGRASDHAASGASRDAVGNLVKGAGQYVIGDWKITEWNATPVGDSLQLDLDMEKDAGDGFKAVIGAHGHINNFNLKDDLHEIASGTKMAMSIKNLNVEMTFTWEVAKNTPGIYTTEDRIKLPAPISIPLAQYLGGLPVFLEIGGALLVHPALTGGGELAKGSYKLAYSGGVGITGENGDVNATSDGEGTVEIVEDSGLSAVAPVGMVIAVAAPRLELSLGLAKIFPLLDQSPAVAAVDAKIEKLAKAHLSPEVYQALAKSPLGTAVLSNTIKSEADVFAQIIVTTGATRTGSSALIACSRIITDLTAQVGINGNLFGVESGKHTKNAWTHNWVRVEPPGARPCADMTSK